MFAYIGLINETRTINLKGKVQCDWLVTPYLTKVTTRNNDDFQTTQTSATPNIKASLRSEYPADYLFSILYSDSFVKGGVRKIRFCILLIFRRREERRSSVDFEVYDALATRTPHKKRILYYRGPGQTV